MDYQHIKVPSDGEIISYKDNKIQVPDRPIVGYIEGDGIGVDVGPVMLKVIDAAVEKAYSGSRSIAWMEIFAGEKADSIYGEFLPEETLDAIKKYCVTIK